MIDLLAQLDLWALVVLISVLGAFARMANYAVGQRGEDMIQNVYPRIKPKTWDSVLTGYRKLGPTPLLGAGIPIIGTVLTIGAGMVGINRTLFFAMVVLAKVIRNWVLVFLIWWLL